MMRPRQVERGAADLRIRRVAPFHHMKEWNRADFQHFWPLMAPSRKLHVRRSRLHRDCVRCRGPVERPYPDDNAKYPDRRGSRPGRHAIPLAHRTDRNAAAGLADRADPARPDRDDDHRSRAARAAGRPCRRGGRARPYRAVRGVRARHGPGLGGRAARRAGLWRARSAHGAPRAARRAVGCDPARPPAQRRPTLRQGHPAVSRPDRGGGDACRPLSLWTGLVPDPGLVVHCGARLHGRGQSAGARPVDHARRNPRQRVPRLCADLWRVRVSAPRPAGRRHRHHHRQYVHVRGRDLGLLRAAPVQEVSGDGPVLAPGLAAVSQAAGDRRTDFRRPSCWNTACSPRPAS